MSIGMKSVNFDIWGCTDGENISKCKDCKLEKWECYIFQDQTKHEFLYTIGGAF